MNNITSLDSNIKHDFLKRCRQFLITCCVEIKERFDFADPILIAIRLLDPKYSNNKPNTIISLINAMPRITASYSEADIEEIDDQWRLLQISG